MAYNPDTMSFDVPDTDMVYVSGLPDGTTEEQIAEHFGSIGLLKQDKKKGKPKIWLYRDKATNALKVSCGLFSLGYRLIEDFNTMKYFGSSLTSCALLTPGRWHCVI